MSNGNGNGKDKDKKPRQGMIASGVSYLDNLWDKHATKIVLLVLLICLAIWYRKEVYSAASTGASAVGNAVSSATSSVTGLFSAENGQAGETMSTQLGPGELGTANVPTPTELRRLFNF